MKLKLIKVLFLILITVPLGSCRNFVELEDRLIVLGAAVDYDNNKYTVTAEVVDYQQSSAASVSTEYYTGSGESMFDAIRNIIKISGKRLFWAHMEVLIISKDLAYKGIYPILDWLDRDPELRDDVKILVSREETAKEIIECKNSKNAITSYVIHAILKNNKSIPKYPNEDLWEFTSDYTKPGIEPIAATIKIVLEDGEKKIQVSGTAVFLNDVLLGFLGDNGSMDLFIIRNKLKGGLIHLNKNITNLDTDLVLEVFNSSTKINPKVEDGEVIVEINVKPILGLALAETVFDFTKKDTCNLMEKLCEEYLEASITETIKTIQEEYKSDICGFGHKINISLPAQWKNLKSDWNNNFSNLNFLVKVEAEIKGSGELSKPIKKE